MIGLSKQGTIPGETDNRGGLAECRTRSLHPHLDVWGHTHPPHHLTTGQPLKSFRVATTGITLTRSVVR